MFGLVMIAVLLGVLGGLAISLAPLGRYRRRALIVWCCSPLAISIAVMVWIGLNSKEVLATWPLLWVGLLLGIPTIIFALSAVLGFWMGRRARPEPVD